MTLYNSEVKTKCCEHKLLYRAGLSKNDQLLSDITTGSFDTFLKVFFTQHTCDEQPLSAL